MAALLIVNADDYGLTTGVSRAILGAHSTGIVTSTSVLALGPAFESTVDWLQDAPSLGVGAHFAAVGEDPPLLGATEIPTLVNGKGRLRMSWREFLPAMAAGRIDPADLRREFAAQMERIVGAGLRPDHVDTHQNLHLWPAVRDVVLDIGDQYGVRAIRVTRSASSGTIGTVVRRLARRLERQAVARGWRVPEASTGLDEAGSLDTPSMITALFRLRALDVRSAELATHPGEDGDPELARYRWEYSWAAELDALCRREVRDAVDELGFELGTFADLVDDREVRG